MLTSQLGTVAIRATLCERYRSQWAKTAPASADPGSFENIPEDEVLWRHRALQVQWRLGYEDVMGCQPVTEALASVRTFGGSTGPSLI